MADLRSLVLSRHPLWSLVPVAALVLAGCYSIQRVRPTQLNNADAPKQVIATRKDGSEVTLTNPRLQHDTIIGMANGTETQLAVRDLSALHARMYDATRTRNLTLLGFGVVAGGLILYLNTSGSGATTLPSGQQLCDNDQTPPQLVPCCEIQGNQMC